jgi:hypothetical protein
VGGLKQLLPDPLPAQTKAFNLGPYIKAVGYIIQLCEYPVVWYRK